MSIHYLYFLMEFFGKILKLFVKHLLQISFGNITLIIKYYLLHDGT